MGASFFPVETLKKICGPILEKLRAEITVPGLLVIDTPGHEAFFNLRRRGGSVADIAILVVDVIKGFEIQTYESIEILKARKAPFLIAANKIDLIPGWKAYPNSTFLETFEKQDPFVKKDLEGRIHTMVGNLSYIGLKGNRFDKIKDFTKNIALVPVSAKTGEGIPELLAVLIGLTQQYMQKQLLFAKGTAKGTVLEVIEEIGLGTTINTIIYDGILRKNSIIVVGGKKEPILTKIRALLLPKPLDEIRDPREKFMSVKEVSASTGVKIVAPNLEDALAGAPIYGIEDLSEVPRIIETVKQEIEKIKISTEKMGVIVKADTLGSLEALVYQLERQGYSIRKADIGDVSKIDIIEADVVKKSSPLQGVILAFNVKVLPDAKELASSYKIDIIESNIIYHLLEQFEAWLKQKQEEIIKQEFDVLIKPGIIKVLKGYVFRRSKPAIFGIKVLKGTIEPGYALLRKDGKIVGRIMQIQDKGESIQKAIIGKEVAISMREPTIGRQIKEGDILYVYLPSDHKTKLMVKFKSLLREDEKEALEEIDLLSK